MNKLKLLFTLTLSCLLTGCQLAILDPKGIIAAAEKNLLVDAAGLMLIVVIPAIVMALVFAWRYRKNNNAKYTPNKSHNTLIEAICWGVPLIIIGILATMTWISTQQLDPYHPLKFNKKPILIEAVALNWKWLFIYPKQQIATVNYIQIPIHVPIRFYVTADAPMNSIEIPQLAGQIYAMPGMRTKLNLMASDKGSFVGLSTNFSGEGFSGMHFTVKVTSQSQFNHWVQKVKRSRHRLTMHHYNRLARPSQNNPVEYFSHPTTHLFTKIIKKYMGPDMEMSAH